MGQKIIFIKDTDESQDRINDFYAFFLNALKENQLDDAAQVVRVADIGIYNRGVVVKISGDEVIYANVKEENIPDIVRQTVKEGKVIAELLFKEQPKQLRIVLRNCGQIDPENIDEYIA